MKTKLKYLTLLPAAYLVLEVILNLGKPVPANVIEWSDVFVTVLLTFGMWLLGYLTE